MLRRKQDAGKERREEEIGGEEIGGEKKIVEKMDKVNVKRRLLRYLKPITLPLPFIFSLFHSLTFTSEV